jgi:ferredoxin
MRVYIDVDSCTGSGTCARVAPAVFRIRNACAEVIEEAVTTTPADVVRDAAKACPWAAIVLEDDQGRRLYP